MSLKWKPRSSPELNVISFSDGRGLYSSQYVDINDLKMNKDLLPHIVYDSENLSEGQSNSSISLGYTPNIYHSKTFFAFSYYHPLKCTI